MRELCAEAGFSSRTPAIASGCHCLEGEPEWHDGEIVYVMRG